MKLFIMIGLPGSGKSTFATDLTAVTVSRDKIRFSYLKENDGYFKYENKVFGDFINQIQSYINEGIDCIADATHLNTKSRYKLLCNLKNLEGQEIIPVFFDVPLEICLERNSKRHGLKFVPEETIKDMNKNLEYPSDYEINKFNYKKILIVKEV